MYRRSIERYCSPLNDAAAPSTRCRTRRRNLSKLRANLPSDWIERLAMACERFLVASPTCRRLVPRAFAIALAPFAEPLAAATFEPGLVSLNLCHAQDLPRQLAGGIDAASLQLGPRLIDELLNSGLQVGRDVIKTHAP